MRRSGLLVTAAVLVLLVGGSTPNVAGSQTPAGVAVPTMEQFRALEARVSALEAVSSSVTTTTPPAPATTSTVPSTATTVPGRGPVCPIAPADSDEAINVAIAACRDGSTVTFPAKRTYHQDGTIWIKGRHDLTIDGNGSTFASSAPNDNSRTVPNFYVMRSSGITLRNMTITGNFLDRGSPTPNRGSVTSNAGVGVAGGEDITLADLKIRDVFGDGVFTANAYYHDTTDQSAGFVRNLRMVRLDVSNAARHCVSPNQGNGIWLVDSVLDRCFLDGIDGEKDNLADPLGDLHFIGNRISNYFGLGLVVPIGGPPNDPVRGIEVRDNTFPTLATASVCNQAIVISGYAGQFFAEVVIADNDIYSWKAAIVVSRALSGSVSGNRITHPAHARPGDCGSINEPDVVVSESPNLKLS